MALELEGRIARKLNVQTGTSARGAWAKQEFILEYQEGNFPTQVCLNVWGDDKVKISFNLSSREYNGRWYTDVRAWRIEPAGAAAPAQTPGYNSAPATDSYPTPAAAPMPSADDMSSPLEDDDLPF